MITEEQEGIFDKFHKTPNDETVVYLSDRLILTTEEQDEIMNRVNIILLDKSEFNVMDKILLQLLNEGY